MLRVYGCLYQCSGLLVVTAQVDGACALIPQTVLVLGDLHQRDMNITNPLLLKRTGAYSFDLGCRLMLQDVLKMPL